MKFSKLLKQFKTGRFEAITQDVGGRRMLFGIARKSRRSRKRHVKYLSKPIDLDALQSNPETEVTLTSPPPEAEAGPAQEGVAHE